MLFFKDVPTSKVEVRKNKHGNLWSKQQLSLRQHPWPLASC